MEMNYDESTLRQLEEELDVKIYPGTEIMTDVGTHHFVRSSGSSSNVLVPQPSENPHDPLNWNPYWKLSVIIIATASNFVMGIGPLALSPMFGDLMEAFNSDLAGVVQFTGVCILVLGFSNFFWVPMSETFGRRPVLIFSSLVCLASNIWRAKATTYGSFMGACVLNGFGAGPCETLQPQIITDTFFLHERGFYNTLYFTFYFGSLMVGPIISGSMALHVGWRSFWWLNVGAFALIIILSIFMFPETKWHRLHPREIHDAVTSPAQQKTSDEVTTEVKGTTSEEEEASDPYLHRGYPSKGQFSIYQPSPNWAKSLFQSFWIPWRLHLYPIVEFAAFVVSWSASCFLTANLTQSQAFAAPPYNWSSQSVGFTNFATLAGAFIGLFTNGLLSDWVSMRATKRNRGIREPEMRLPALVPYVFVSILGNFIIAFGYQYHWDWRAIVIVGYTCAGMQVAALPAIASTYAVDSYKPVVGSVFITITVNKNVWGYGFSKFITPWTEKSGYLPAIMLNMCLMTLWCSFGIVFYFYGKRFRKWTAKSDLHNL
ncbi:putative MFS transporter [Talaromyces proteolyticus]|uniref:MFS transporter n=1 Tax=Talaromyces proteolyticus TaxID=1131652 RepID=A0AAD4Q3Z9_9EURO|nr:putative MFS transporter [Talaromyces proteolyticus]KAH8705624.1 putative MFS transporter [Talaromyces proteolyticus]